KAENSGNVSYDPANHQRMMELRAEKVARVAQEIPDLTINGDEHGKVLVVGWGGTYGAITAAVNRLKQEGKSVSAVHLRYLNPFPRNLGKILRDFDRVLVLELNMGQLAMLLRARFLVDAISLPKVQGRPFTEHEIREKIDDLLERTA
ncbi:MAG: 2-oxoglutarate ferredoxin oxidoreductase subunit alpha, partial [Acidobacteriota bacterium]